MRRAWCFWLTVLAFNAHAADAYRLDAGRTRVSFDVRRLGVPWIAAQFPNFEGSFLVDRNGPDSRIEVSVHTDTIDGLGYGWNERLRSQSWLDTQRFPRMRYVSTQVEFDRSGGAVALGELTLHGVTRPVTLTVNRLVCAGAAAQVSQPCDFAAHAKIRRSDFGLPHGFWLAGDGVEISISGVALPQQNLASAADQAR